MSGGITCPLYRGSTASFCFKYGTESFVPKYFNVAEYRLRDVAPRTSRLQFPSAWRPLAVRLSRLAAIERHPLLSKLLEHSRQNVWASRFRVRERIASFLEDTEYCREAINRQRWRHSLLPVVSTSRFVRLSGHEPMERKEVRQPRHF
jgi:hypothetical protein